MPIMNVFHPDHLYAWEYETNKFSRFYQNVPNDEDRYRRSTDSDIQKELRKYTHSDAIQFAAMSYDANFNNNRPLPRTNNPLPTFQSQDGQRAYYRVLSESRDKYILIACHVNVHGYHRGDLRFLEVNNKTVLKGLTSFSVIGSLFPGDVVAVTKLGRKSKITSNPPTVFNVHPHMDCIFEVQNMTLLTRKEKEREVNFAILENGTAIVEGRGEAMNVMNGRNGGLETDTIYVGSSFVPEKMKVNFTEDFHRKYLNPLTAITSNLPSYPNSLGTIYSYYLCEMQTRLFTTGVNAFDRDTFLLYPNETHDIVEKCVRMGASAAQTVSKGRFDGRGFKMENIRRKGLIIYFSILNPKTHPTEGRWNTNSRLIIESNEIKLTAIIETVVLEESRRNINIAARLSEDSPNGLNFKEIWIVHQRPSSDVILLEKGFFNKLTANYSNGRRIIETLYGGQAITFNNHVGIDVDAIFFFPSEQPVLLNEYQNYYIAMLLAGVPLVLGNSPFGCGKSMTIVTAAIEIHKWNGRFNKHGKQRQQLLITQTNNAGVSLINIASKVSNVSVKFLRYISESNWKTLPKSSKTAYDMPSLMMEMFIDWATGTSDQMREFGELRREFKQAIVKKVTQSHINFESLQGEARRLYQNLEDHKKQNEPSPRILREAFFLVYQPDIIVTTADSLPALIRQNILKPIANIQIDEASQLPEHTLIYLLQQFPHAGFGLVGDIKQLPPHCENELNGLLKDYGIGNTMERALNADMFPTSILRYVYRCHPATTKLLSDLFYDGNLICGVEENDRNEFMRMRKDIWPNPNFPILVLNHEEKGHRVGTSVANDSERHHVMRIVDCLTEQVNGYKLKDSDIGIISFYRAQTSLLTESFRETKVKCGTVDGFQGTEREVMIVCCTSDKPSDFMKLGKRLNVAMSRARQVTIIIGNVAGLRNAIYWKSIVQEAQNNSCVIDDISSFGW